MAFFLPLFAPLLEGAVTDVVTTAATSVARSAVTHGVESIAKGAVKEEIKRTARKAASSVQNKVTDKVFREKWTPSQLAIVGPQHPGKNIMIVCTKHDASKLQGVEHSVLTCQCPASKSTVSYECYAFDSGIFELKGDGGYENWAFKGKFVRDGKKARQALASGLPLAFNRNIVTC